MPEFNKVKKKGFRKRKHSSESSEDSDSDQGTSSVVEETKGLQKLRKRQAGVSAEDLSTVKEFKAEKQKTSDPFKMETGGFVDMKNLKKKPVTAEEIEQIGTSFAAETNRRDEDADMLKYVEEELAKRKGIEQKEEEQQTSRGKDPMDALYAMPEHLKMASLRKKTEDMLSNQMLSGIPEVDLGIEAKIRNIEATEDAKQQLATERRNRKERDMLAFVPTNMAVNFVQHNRFNIEDSTPILKKVEAPKPVPLRVGDADRPPTDRPSTVSTKDHAQPSQGARGTEKATDDFHYEKFKKQMRRF